MVVEGRLYADNVGLPIHSPPFLLTNSGSSSHMLLQQQQQQPGYMQYQQPHNMQLRNQHLLNNNLCPQVNGNRQPLAISRSLATESSRDGLDVDPMVRFQNQKLLGIMQEQQKRQMELVLKEWESKAQFLLDEKEEEMAEAMAKKMELEAMLKQMEDENQKWQKVSQEHQEHIESLNNAMKRVEERAARLDSGNEDVESCCDVKVIDETPEENTLEEERKEKLGTCKRCNSRSCSVVLVPCGHLCSCVACRGYFDTCPICKMVKVGSIEVNFDFF